MLKKPSLKIGGLIASYSLEDWWLESFTSQEREYMNSICDRFGIPPNTCFLDSGELSEAEMLPQDFLDLIAARFRKSDAKLIVFKMREKAKEVAILHSVEKPGYFNSRFIGSYVEEIKDMKRAGEYEKAEAILVHLVEAAQDWTISGGYNYAPRWYADQLRIVRHKLERQKTTVAKD